MKYLKMNLFIILVALTVILVPSFALISSSQTNDTLSDDTLSDDTLSNDTFSSLSREFAQNQSGSDDEVDQEADD
jgi:uncharacterized membrane protein YdfJ with MMPL/SSD domain